MSGRHFLAKKSDKLDLLLLLTLYIFCFYLPSVTAQPVEKAYGQAERAEVLIKIADLLETKYVLPVKAKEYADRFRERYRSGFYDTFSNENTFAEQVGKDLVDITGDRHTNFRLIQTSDFGEKPEHPLHHPLRYHLLGIKENKGFTKLEWFDGNIGYLDIRRFYFFPDIKDRVIAAINFVSNADAIIIDLRENGGGSGDYLSSYFLPYPTQLNSWYSREDNYLQEFWTMNEIGTKRLTKVPLFLLTSSKTFSAAESFAYDMKVRKRAIIIGDTTKGGAHSVDLFQIEGRYELYLSTARAVNPLTGENWEGIGVIPDIPVPSEQALDTALVLSRKAGEEYGKKKEDSLKLVVDKMQIQMDKAEKQIRKQHFQEGDYLLDSLFQLAARYGLLNEFFIDVLAYNYSSSEDQQILYALLKKRIKYFPESTSAYEALAYAYYKNKKNDLAVATYKLLLKMDPDNKNARKMIHHIHNKS